MFPKRCILVILWFSEQVYKTPPNTFNCKCYECFILRTFPMFGSTFIIMRTFITLRECLHLLFNVSPV